MRALDLSEIHGDAFSEVRGELAIGDDMRVCATALYTELLLTHEGLSGSLRPTLVYPPTALPELDVRAASLSPRERL